MIRNEIILCLLAVQFLTRVPMPGNLGFTSERFAATVRYYPLVGALIGGFAAIIFWLSLQLFPLSLSVLLSTALTIFLTGAFHEDGLADCFDGIGGGSTRERALDIMKDSRIGVYGATALMAVLAMKVSALAALSPPLIVAVLISGHCLSRLSSVGVIASSRYVRDHGTGKPVSGGISLASLVFAGFTGVVALCFLAWVATPMTVVFAVVGGLAGHILMRAVFEKKLGGYTGDTLGAVQQVSEIGFYLGVVAWL